jgi:hypothetical protein
MRAIVRIASLIPHSCGKHARTLLIANASLLQTRTRLPGIIFAEKRKSGEPLERELNEKEESS